MVIQTLEGHTDAVWDIVLLPLRDPPKAERPEERLVSASADGSIKVWELDVDRWNSWYLKASYTFDGAIPTCLAVYNLDFGKVIVGLDNGLVKLWDVITGEEVRSFGEVNQGKYSGHI